MRTLRRPISLPLQPQIPIRPPKLTFLIRIRPPLRHQTKVLPLPLPLPHRHLKRPRQRVQHPRVQRELLHPHCQVQQLLLTKLVKISKVLTADNLVLVLGEGEEKGQVFGVGFVVLQSDADEAGEEVERVFDSVEAK